MGLNPKDVKAAEALIKKKNEDIVALRKQLKLPPMMHPQTAEVIEKKAEEELMDLILKLNEQLKDTEQKLEKSLKGRHSESTSQPQNVVPVVSTTVRSTLATALAPNVPLATTENGIGAVTGISIGTSQVGTSSQSTEELIKSMEEMKLQVSELQKLKEKFVTLK